MANLTPYAITLGGTDYPAKYAGLLAYIEPYLTNLETFSFSGGNVRVGSGSPIEKLDIVGNIYSLRTGGAKLRLADQNNEVSVESLPVGVASEMVFKTNTVERMRIDKDGNLGLGVTPSAHGSNYTFLDVGVYTSFGSQTSGTSGANIGWNAAGGASGNSWVYKRTGDVARLLEIDTSGFKFYIAPSGTAGNAISFTQAMTIDSSGRLGIGTTSPSERLHVSNTSSAYIKVSSSDTGSGTGLLTSNATNSYLIGAGANTGGSGLEFRDVTNGVNRMVLTSGGNFGIGTTTVSAKLHVSGNVSYTIPATFAGALGNAAWATGFGSQAVNTSILATDSIVGAAVYSVSDKRLKSNITPLPGNAGLEFVKAVDPVSFDWKTDNGHDTGFIAQALMTKGYGHLVSAIPDAEMEEVTHEDGNVSPAGARFVVRYDSIVPILHAAIRDQQALIEALMARVAALESN